MLNPLLLWFLPLALVPVILHLITRRRLKTVELSTYRFLMDSYVQQRRRLRLLEWLIMALRVAFVALLVLLLARPVVEGFGFLNPTGGGRDVTLIVDASPTMSLRSEGTTSLERARGAASAVLDRLGPEDHVRIVAAGREPSVVAQGFAQRGHRLNEALDQIEPEAGTADLAAALRLALDARPRGAPMVYLLSDTMQSTWADLAGQHVLDRLDAETRWTVMNVGPDEPVVNLAVTGQPPQALRTIKGLPVMLTATLVNSSTDETAETVLSVYLDDRQVDQTPVTLSPGQRLSRRFHVTPDTAGHVRGRFEITGDAFPDDDVFRFSLHVHESIRVLLVAPADDGGSASRASDRAETYIRTALESPRHARPDNLGSDERQLASALSIESIPHDQLDASRLAAADVVLLADVPLDAERGELLRSYVEDGGGLMVLPGPNVDADVYNETLLAAGSTGPLALAEPRGDVDDEARFRQVTQVRRSHPVLAAFEATGERDAAAGDEAESFFQSIRVYRQFPIELREAGDGDDDADDASADGRTRQRLLAQLSDDAPLLAEAAVGAGRVLVLAVPATPKWSNLPLKPEFVPLMLRSVAHLQRPAEVVAPSAVMPGQPAAIRLTDRWSAAQVQATDPSGKRHAIELHRSGRQRIGALLETRRPGNYVFEILPRHDDAPDRLELGFAVNLDNGGASFAMADEDAVRAALAPADVVYLRGSPDDPLLVEQLTHQREIWRTLIWIVFAVIGLEFLMATLRPSREPAARGMVRPSGGGSTNGSASSGGGPGPRRGVGRLTERLRDTFNPLAGGVKR